MEKRSMTKLGMVMVIVGLAIFLAACGTQATQAPAAIQPTQYPAGGGPAAATPAAGGNYPAPSGDSDIARPSNPGGPGAAIDLTGDATKGAVVFKNNCVKCHGEEGKTGVVNKGSKDGTVPNLNPIDETLVNKDTKIFATNIDLFVEHGSTPEGDNVDLKMPAFGDQKTISDQDIADVIAYVISLNH